jgi:hypothetical protein
VHVAERYGTLVTANLHYGDNHTVTTDDPNEMRDFAGVAAEMTLLRNEKLNREGKPVPDSRSGPAVRAT